MRVLVGGGRYYDNVHAVYHELIGFHWRTPITVIIHGGLSGAGAIAEAWARRSRVAVVRYPPNWECLGKKAEKVRNDFMLADSRPDFVIAFPGGRNTADLVAKASAVGLPVLHAAWKNKAEDLRRVCVSGGAETTGLVSRHGEQRAVASDRAA
jgi:YspA, cpYpsA-related SLOG family